MSRLIAILLLLFTACSRAADLEFEGLRSYTAKDLKEAIAGRLDYIAKRDATEYRADDAAFLIESYLHSHGLPDATVSGELTGDKILLIVDEGIAKFLGPLTVVGFDKPEAVQDQFKAPFPESGERRAFDAGAIETGLGRIRDLLHADGYWEGNVTSLQGSRNAQGEIPFTLTVTTGPLFTLTRPKLETPVPATPQLLEKLQDVTGDTATAEKIVSIRKTISESYRRLGYTDISLVMIRETNGSKLSLSFILTPGKKFTVRSFQTKGLSKTKPDRVRQRFSGIVGGNYDENFINEEIKKLLSTGAFESIRLESREVNETDLDLTLHLSEGKARGYSFALGYGSIEGYVLGARYYDRNLSGRLWNLSAGAEFTSLGGLGEVALSNPFFLNRDFNLANRAFLLSRDFDNYRKLQGGLGTELSWKNGEHYSLTVGLEASQTSIDSVIPSELIGPSNYLVNRLSFRQFYDRRDDSALPSDGWFARLENSLGFATGDGGIGFFETEAQISYYDSIGENGAYSLGLRGGLIIPTGDDADLPIDLRQFLGGANTIRSFPELEMGASFNGNALGGTAWWVANAEYTHTLVGPVRGLVFLDAASLDSEVELAAGIGVRVNLPVGPIRLEYGRSLSRDSGEPGGAFHFAIGTTF